VRPASQQGLRSPHVVIKEHLKDVEEEGRRPASVGRFYSLEDEKGFVAQ